MDSLEIISFKNKHQEGVNQMMKEISQEFEEPIFSRYSITMQTANQIRNHYFWVAQLNKKVIGTVGIVSLEGKKAALRSMFVLKEYRGPTLNTASALLEAAISFSKKRGIQQIYLGTMVQFKAGQKFYQKQGFSPVSISELPKDFAPNPLDTLFYKRTL